MNTYRKMKHKKYVITIIIILVLIIVYTGAYINALKRFKKPVIRYYTSDDWVEYGGVKYQVSAKMYSREELINKFDLTEYESVIDKNKVYIVVDKNAKRVAESTGNEHDELFFIISSKYWHVSVEPDIKELIQKENYIQESELQIGEETSGYRVYSVNKNSLTKKLWDDIWNTTAYYEMEDYYGSEYIRRIRVLN